MFYVSEKKIVLDGQTMTVDFGKDAFAILELETDLPAETNLTMAIGEVLKKTGGLDPEPGGSRIFRRQSRRCPAGKSRFCFTMLPHASPYRASPSVALPPEIPSEIIPFRYVELQGGKGLVTLRRKEYFDEFDENDSYFESSDPKLNAVWEFCRYTMKATSALGVFIDGERERVAYEGDSYINQRGWFAVSRSGAIARRTLERFETYPTWPVEWQLLTPLLAEDYWMLSGDRSTVERVLNWLPARLLPELSGKDGLLRGGRVIVDWPPEQRDNYEFGEVDLVPNCYLVRALESMARLTGDGAWSLRAQELRKTLRNLFFRNGLPVDNPASSHTSLHSAVFALWADVAEDPEPLFNLIQAKGMVCSVYVAQYLLEVLFRYGKADYALALLTSEGPHSWLGMLRDGATMTMEAWNNAAKPNQDWNHPWGAAPANLIPHFLCGLYPTGPGFTSYRCKPAKLPLDWKLKHPTPFGAILAEYRHGKLEIKEERAVSATKK